MNRLRIIINTTNLRKGGALQASSALIEDLKKNKKHEFHIMLSPAMSNFIQKENLPSHMKFYECDYPRKIASSLINKELDDLERKILPDCVFSVFGPTYWKPKSPHIMGFANGLYLFDDLPFYKKMELKSKIWEFIRKHYHRHLLRKYAPQFVVETDLVRARLSKFLKIQKARITVIPNAFHSVFNNEIRDLGLLPKKETNEFRFITVSSFYKHKNLEIINRIIPLLEKESIQCKFILTITKKEFEKHFDYKSPYLLNIGPVDVNQCPYLYHNCDALFLPTLVECFSVSYLEAMKSKIPIITSDYDFSRGICEDAALYFDPFDEIDIFEKIKLVIDTPALRQELVINGESKLKTYPDSSSRTESYIEECQKLLEENKIGDNHHAK